MADMKYDLFLELPQYSFPAPCCLQIIHMESPSEQLAHEGKHSPRLCGDNC